MNHKTMNMRKLRKNQRGFSLLELLLVIAITGIITAAITTTVFQVFAMNTRTANHMSAVSQVQQAGKLVSQDVLQAQGVDIVSEFLKLTWTDWATGDGHEIIYTWGDMPSGALKILWREHYINSSLDATTKVAEYIDTDPTKTSCDWADGVLTFTVTATLGEESETREYRIQPRSGT